MVETCKIRTGYCRIITTLDSRPRFTCRPPGRLIRTGTPCATEDITGSFCRIFGIFQTGRCSNLEIYILTGLDIQIRTQTILVVAVG